MKRSVTVTLEDGEEVLVCRRVTPAQDVKPTPRAQLLADYVTIPRAAEATGLSEKAIRRKIEDGKWLEGREYRRSPDGGIFISMKGYAQWVENGG